MADKEIYQFKITLQGAPLPIWRRIQVPASYSFWDLHVAIQDAMGWLDCHLHDFATIDPEFGEEEHIGLPDPKFDEFNTRHGKDTKIRSYFGEHNTTAIYIYDFGDGWEHTIEFEGEFKQSAEQKYPVCLDGQNACPPEDVGGVWGYEDFLKIIKNPKDDGHESMLEWIGGSFDPHEFDPQQVRFSDPKKELKERLDIMGC